MLAVALMMRKISGRRVYRMAIVKAVPEDEGVIWVRQEWIEPPEVPVSIELYKQAKALAKERGLHYIGAWPNRSPAKVSHLELLAHALAQE
jgi:hypothetical protein